MEGILDFAQALADEGVIEFRRQAECLYELIFSYVGITTIEINTAP